MFKKHERSSRLIKVFRAIEFKACHEKPKNKFHKIESKIVCEAEFHKVKNNKAKLTSYFGNEKGGLFPSRKGINKI